MLPYATMLNEVDEEFKKILTADKIAEIVGWLPDDWLHWGGSEETPEDIRQVYIGFLTERLKHSEIFIKEAQHARETLI